MAHSRRRVRHRWAICHRRTLTGRHPDAGTARHHPAMRYRRTLMGRRPVMARLPGTVLHHARRSHHRTLTSHLPATDLHHAWTSRHRTLTAPHPATAHLPATVRHQTT